MSVRHSVVCQDADGDKQTGLDVKLYEYGDVPGVDPPVGTYTDNTDGSYYITVAATGKYSVAVAGVIQDELDGIYIVVDDLATQAQLAAHEAEANPHSGSAAASDLTDHINEANPHSGSASVTDLDAVKGVGWTTETVKENADDIAALQTDVGDLDFSGQVFVEGAPSLTNAVERLDKQCYINSIITGGVATEQSRRQYLVFHYPGAMPTGGGQVVGQLYHEGGMPLGDTPFPLIRGGSITAIGACWKTGTIGATESVQIGVAPWGEALQAAVVVENADVASNMKITYFDVGTSQFDAGSKLGGLYGKDANATLTDVVVVVEITLSAL